MVNAVVSKRFAKSKRMHGPGAVPEIHPLDHRLAGEAKGAEKPMRRIWLKLQRAWLSNGSPVE